MSFLLFNTVSSSPHQPTLLMRCMATNQRHLAHTAYSHRARIAAPHRQSHSQHLLRLARPRPCQLSSHDEHSIQYVQCAFSNHGRPQRRARACTARGAYATMSVWHLLTWSTQNALAQLQTRSYAQHWRIPRYYHAVPAGRTDLG